MSYPISGQQARDVLRDMDRANRGDVDPEYRKLLEDNIDKALYFFRNAPEILSKAKTDE